MANRLLATCAVLDLICISKTELYRRINRGEFPKPVPIGRHRVAFVEAEIEEWIASRIEARGSGAAVNMNRARATSTAARQ